MESIDPWFHHPRSWIKPDSNFWDCLELTTSCFKFFLRFVDPAKAQECLSQYKSFSCDEFMGFATGATVKPAACDQTCR